VISQGVILSQLLNTPAPIRLSWSLNKESVAGPVAAAIGDPDTAPAFPPLLSQIRIKRTMPTELI